MIQIPNCPEFPICREMPELAEKFSFETLSMSVNGQKCPVRKCRVSAMPFNRPWPGYQRPLDQTELSAFALFSGDEPVTVVYTADADFDTAVVRPLSAGVTVKKVGEGVAEFTLPAPGQYVLELDSERRACHIFFDPITEYPEKDSATYSFGPGIHAPGTIHLRSGDSVYIDPEAIVYGVIYGEDVHGVRVFGGGILDGGMEKRMHCNCYHLTKSTVKFFNSTDIRFEGITILDSSCWSMNFFGCSNVEIDRVKIVGQWRYNTDGIDLVNSDHVTIRNSFVRSFDDTIVLKGCDFWDFTPIPWETGRSVTDILVSNCVLWCGWGKTLEIGFETGAPEYARIRFENCDLIHNSGSAMDIQNGNWADVHDVVFSDIRVEYQQYSQPPVLQDRDDQRYQYTGRIHVPDLISMVNRPFILGRSDTYGSTHDICFENIKVFAEPSVPLSRLRIIIENVSDAARYENFTFRSFEINGVDLDTPESIKMEIKGNVSGIHWEKKSRTNGKFAYLALGNSVTLHGKCGYWWSADRGMAATTQEKDYVHLVKAELEKRYGEVLLSTYNFSQWELMYYDRAEALEVLDPYLHDELNLVTLQLGENVQDHRTFREDFKEMLCYIQEKAPNAKLIVVGEVSTPERNETKKAVCAELGVPYAETGIIFSVPGYEAGMGTLVEGEDGEWHAIDHAGVAGHPGDNGMKLMAEKVIECL